MEKWKQIGAAVLVTLATTSCASNEKHEGGVWGASTPKDGSIISSPFTLDFHAYPAAGSLPIKEVKFTGYWPGAKSPDLNNPSGWQVLCDETKSDHGDIYNCNVDPNKLDIPPGKFTVSVDVTGQETNFSPNGTKTFDYEPDPVGSL